MNERFEQKYGQNFTRFMEYLLAHEDYCETAAQLQREGVDLLRVFVNLQVYIEGRSVAEDRRKRGRNQLHIINRGVRRNGLAPEIGRWLRNRSELAHSVNGFSRVRNIDSLASAHIYLELRTRRRVTMTELAHLIDATYWGLNRKGVVDAVEIARELRRHRQKHARFLKLLRDDIAPSSNHY